MFSHRFILSLNTGLTLEMTTKVSSEENDQDGQDAELEPEGGW